MSNYKPDRQEINYSKIYSVTRLSMFDQCPKEYEFSFVDPIYKKMKNKLKNLPQNIFSFYTLGKAVHNAITLYYHLPLEKRNKKNLKEILKNTWLSEAMWYKKPPLGKWGGFKDLEEEREIYGQALWMLENFFKFSEIEPIIEFLPTKDIRKSIDDYINLITPLNDNFDISGKFDLVTKNKDESLNIIDFKTSKKEEANFSQLRFYKLLAELKFKKPVNKASFYFLRTGNKLTFNLKDEKTDKIKQEIIDKISLINATKEFKTNPTKLCKYCLFKTFCPEKETVMEIAKDFQSEDDSDDLPF